LADGVPTQISEISLPSTASRTSAVTRAFPPAIAAADLHLTPNGKFLYVSERTSDTLSGFAVDAASGKLTFLSSAHTERQPRGFAIDPKGRFLVATGEKSETISVYSIDQANGALKFLNKYPTGKGSSWVEIASFD
jgi:6-phosphogluconolactonase